MSATHIIAIRNNAIQTIQNPTNERKCFEKRNTDAKKFASIKGFVGGYRLQDVYAHFDGPVDSFSNGNKRKTPTQKSKLIFTWANFISIKILPI